MSKGGLRARLRRLRRELGAVEREVEKGEDLVRELRKLKLKRVEDVLERYVKLIR